MSVKEPGTDGLTEQVMHKDVMMACMDEGKAALTLDMCDVTINVYSTLDLHLFQHGVTQYVKTNRTHATAGKQEKNIRYENVS